MEHTFANTEVLDFYKELPFNYSESVEEHVRSVRENDLSDYPSLIPLLSNQTRVLDVGCGIGWLGMRIAYHYHAHVTGIDFNPVAVERAREINSELNLKVKLEVEDLFVYVPKSPFDVVVSLGVLHHTNDCHAAIRKLCTTFVVPDGHVFIGLYHKYGRQPFLEHFRQMKESGASEEDMLARYRKLHSWIRDDVKIRSWFRDQVLHPHETQHTLREVVQVLDECDMTLISTSINRFESFDTLDELYELELSYSVIARQRLEDDTYFPGFFSFLARRN